MKQSQTEKELGFKTCSHCGEQKPVSKFSLSRADKDGYCHKCKVCTRIYQVKKCQSVKYKTKTVKYSNRREILIKYNKTHSNEIKARYAVFSALRLKKITQLPCEVCGKKKTNAHHFKGYNKENWLDIQWLCHTHHLKSHYDK